MLKYTLDQYLSDYLRTIMTPGKYELIIRSFDTLYNFNFVCGNEVFAELSDLEAALMDIVAKENIDTDTVNDYIYSIVSDFLITYLKKYYIVMSPETRLSVLIDVVNAIYVLYTVDIDLIELIQIQLEDEEHGDDSLKLASILDQYTEISSIELYEYISDMNEIFFKNLHVFLDKKMNQTETAMNDGTIDIVLKLTSIDPAFNNSVMIKNILRDGYIPTTFDMLATDMYTNIEKQYNDFNNVAYEIVTALYLAKDTSADMLTAYHDKINLDAVSFVTDGAMARVIDVQVIDLITKVNNTSR